MPRHNTVAVLEKALTVLRHIQIRHTVTRRDLVAALGVSDRTVRRYLEALDRAGFHLETDADGHFRRRIRLNPETSPENPLELIALTRDELIRLYLHLSGIHHAGGRKVSESLWEKIRNAMGSEPVDATRVKRMLTGFEKAYKSYDTAVARAVIATLLEALYAGRTCRVTYRTPDGEGPRTYRIEPYRLFEFDGGLYCYCRVPRFDEVRMLAVERIQRLDLNAETFEKTEAALAEIEQKKERAFRIIDDGEPLKVTLRFRPDVAFYVAERTWHPTQSLTRHPDGSLTLAFCASGRIEIERWIRGWGDACEVVEPEELREAVQGASDVDEARND